MPSARLVHFLPKAQLYSTFEVGGVHTISPGFHDGYRARPSLAPMPAACRPRSSTSRSTPPNSTDWISSNANGAGNPYATAQLPDPLNLRLFVDELMLKGGTNV
jgi:hypothetical protein